MATTAGRRRPRRVRAQRALDLALLALLAPVVVPLALVTALAIALSLGRPVLFTQVRPGLHGVPFRLIKFRTMIEAHDARGQPLPDARRLARLGRFVRATSLDELPEFWNVLEGTMSVVGPRPLLMEYLPLYTPEQARRHEVKPGITGWAQVNGRNALSWEAKFTLDVWYVDHASLRLDLWILALTLIRLVSRHGISAAGHATMPRFTGSADRCR